MRLLAKYIVLQIVEQKIIWIELKVRNQSVKTSKVMIGWYLSLSSWELEMLSTLIKVLLYLGPSTKTTELRRTHQWLCITLLLHGKKSPNYVNIVYTSISISVVIVLNRVVKSGSEPFADCVNVCQRCAGWQELTLWLANQLSCWFLAVACGVPGGQRRPSHQQEGTFRTALLNCWLETLKWVAALFWSGLCLTFLFIYFFMYIFVCVYMIAVE